MPTLGTYDIAIVGGGIVGCSSAFALMRRGLRVALVERGAVAGGTTSNSFAWVNATSKTADEDYHRLNARGQEGYRALAVEFGEQQIGLNRCGMLRWASKGDAARYNPLREQFERLRAYDYPAEWIGARTLQRLEPHMAFPADAEAIFALADPCLDAPKFTRFLAEQIRRGGGQVFEHCPARELVMDDDGTVTGLETEQGRIEARRVLVAAGPDTAAVMSELTGFAGFANHIPVQRVPGLLVSTPSTAPAELIRHVIYADCDPEVHLLPLPNGGIKIGADDTDGLASADEQDEAKIREGATQLLERARRLLPGFPGPAVLDACHVGIGIRPYPSDGKTLAGAWPGSNGLYVVATHSGVTLSPAVSELMADLITTGQVPAALAPFGWERCAGF